MDTNRLRYFCTVAQTVNIHRAAELLHLSPAALSKSIKLLEEEVGLQLLLPAGRGIAITEEGRRFAMEAERVLSQVQGLHAFKQKRANGGPTLRLGSFEVFTTHALAKILPRESFTLTLHELVPGKLEEAIAAGQLDLGITYLPIPHPELDFLKVATLTMGVYGRPELLNRFDLKDLPFAVPVTPLQGTPTKVVGLDGWPDNLYVRSVRYRVTLMESALELCRRGQAVAYLPKFVVKLHNEKVTSAFQLQAYSRSLPIGSKYTQQPVYLIKRKSRDEDQWSKKIAKELRLMCK